MKLIASLLIAAAFVAHQLDASFHGHQRGASHQQATEDVQAKGHDRAQSAGRGPGAILMT